MYLGPLASISHTGPSGISRYFYRNKWMKYDMSEEDIKHYDESGGFKVKRVVIKKKVIKPKVEEQEEEIVYGG